MSESLAVLIVEDEPIIRVFLKRLVKSAGHTLVGAVPSANEALPLIAQNHLDLIFMDINLEGELDGISLVRKMQSPSNPLVYFISAYNDMETIEEALSTHAYSYITKPIKEEDIFIAFTMAKKSLPQKKEVQRVRLSDSLYYETKQIQLFYLGKLVKLSKTEQALVDIFVKNINTNVSIETLENTVWLDKGVSLSTIRGAIASLRKKVPELNIENNIARGYVLYEEGKSTLS